MNIKTKHVKFESADHSAFKTELLNNIEAYFNGQDCGKKANKAMLFKIFVILASFLCSYLAIVSNLLPMPALISCLVLFGFSNVLIAFNISHDAAHNAIFKNPKLNALFSYSFNLIGVNCYIWNIKHNLSHHTFTNVPGYDMDIEQVKIARLVEHVPLKWYHRYQHIYVPLLYPLTSLYMIFFKDFMMFATRQYGNSLHPGHPKKEYVILILSKFFYFLYALIIPLLVIHLPWYKILAGFVLMHLFMGIFLAIILFPVHALHDSPFPQVNQNGFIENNWFRHQVETSTNYGVNSKLLFWLSGGLNIHIPHHLCPAVCHIHYYKLAPIIKAVAQRHGVLYRENSVFGALKSHLLYLKEMGRGKIQT